VSALLEDDTAVPELDAALLAARVRELEERLTRERARNDGLENGIAALTRTVDRLREENARLRSTARA